MTRLTRAISGVPKIKLKSIASVASNNKDEMYIPDDPKQVEKHLRNKGAPFWHPLPKGCHYGTPWHVLVCLYIYIYVCVLIYIYTYTCTIKITCINRHMQRPPRSGTKERHRWRGVSLGHWLLPVGHWSWKEPLVQMCRDHEYQRVGSILWNISGVWWNTKGMVPPRHVSVFITALTKVHGDWYND